MRHPITSFFKTLPPHEKKITIPTVVTMARIALTPCIVTAFIMHAWTIGFILFLIAASTDVLDGLLARWYNEKTFLGAFLDPIADKILIVSCFFTLALVQSPLFIIPWWFVAIIAIKELILLGGSWVIVYREGQLDIVPTLLGKYAMFAQVTFIIWVFICYFFDLYPIKTYHAVILLLVFLVMAALLDYVRLGLRYLNLMEKRKSYALHYCTISFSTVSCLLVAQ